MTKYKEYVGKMIRENKDLFDSFGKLHQQYQLDQDKWQNEFNKLGEKVMTTIRLYEDKLCGRSEGSGFGSFVGNLAQKFQDEIRKMFPLIDNVGIQVSSFNIKKITLK